MFKKILLAAVFSAILVVPNAGANMPFPSCFPCDEHGNYQRTCYSIWGFSFCA